MAFCQKIPCHCAFFRAERHSEGHERGHDPQEAAPARRPARWLLRRRLPHLPDTDDEPVLERRLHHERPGHVRARRAPVLLLLVQGDAESRRRGLRVARGLPRRRALPHARQQLQLHQLEGRERRLLLGQPVHRLRPRLQADGRPRAAAHADVPRQPRGRGGHGPRPLPGVDRRQAGRRPHPHRRDRHDLRPRAGRLLDAGLVAGARRLRAERDAHQAAGDDPDGVADRRDQLRFRACGLRPLPQFRPAVGRGAQHGLPAAQGPGRDGPRPRPALQRRRPGVGRAAPRGADRRLAARRPDIRAVHAQRQADEPQHAPTASRASRRRSRSRGSP